MQGWSVLYLSYYNLTCYAVSNPLHLDYMFASSPFTVIFKTVVACYIICHLFMKIKSPELLESLWGTFFFGAFLKLLGKLEYLIYGISALLKLGYFIYYSISLLLTGWFYVFSSLLMYQFACLTRCVVHRRKSMSNRPPHSFVSGVNDRRTYEVLKGCRMRS